MQSTIEPIETVTVTDKDKALLAAQEIEDRWMQIGRCALAPCCGGDPHGQDWITASENVSHSAAYRGPIEPHE